MDVVLQPSSILMVLSSPSGAGKSTLSKLLRHNLGLNVSISATTREPRGKEQNGKDYYFITKAEFEQKIAEEAFIEWAHVHSNYYGTFKETVFSSMAEGQDLLFDIDYKGMMQLKQQLKDRLVSIFILPPSMENLRIRLAGRCENSLEDIECRMRNAYQEIQQYLNYDYIVVNNTIEESYKILESIYFAERAKKARMQHLEIFVNQLLSSS